MSKKHLFSAADNEVATRVQGALAHLLQLLLRLGVQQTSFAAQHNWQTSNKDSFSSDNIISFCKFNFREKRSRVGELAESAELRRELLLLLLQQLLLHAVLQPRGPHTHIHELHEKRTIHIRTN